jgi:hypothetical protein
LDPLFSTAEYAAFAAGVLAANDCFRDEDPHLVAIEKAIPSVNERLRSLESAIRTGLAANASELAELKREQKETRQALADFTAGSFALIWTPGRSRMLPQGFDAFGQLRQRTPPSPLGAPSPPIDLGSSLPLAPTAIEQQRHGERAYVPTNKLSRQVRNIPDLWREWTVGLGGLPSVRALDEAYGTHWRLPNERQYYSTRKVIVDEVVARAGGWDKTAAIDAVVAAMEKERVLAKASLDKVIMGIKAQRKVRSTGCL